jgi:hypothetical protein
MMPKSAIFAGAISFAVVALPCRAQSSGELEIRLPVAAVGLGRTPSAAEASAVSKALGAPVLAGSELLHSLGLADCGTAGEIRALEASHSTALEEFFAGNHERARESWEALSGAVDARPGLLAESPFLRRIVFESRLYLALIAKGANDDAVVDRWIAAAARVEEFEPSASDFPPWVRERLSRLRVELAGFPEGAIEFVDAADCELWVDGRYAGVGQGKYTVPRGRHAVYGRCNGERSLVRDIEVGATPVEFAPELLHNLEVVREGDSLRMEATVDATDDEIARDLFVVARAVGTRRILAIVGRPDAAELFLIDADGVLRKRRALVEDTAALAEAADALAVGDVPTRPDKASRADKPWYRDGVAWGLVASGLAVWGVGLAFGQIYGSPSAEESAAWAMMAGGAVVAGTGGVLFFIPSVAPSSKSGDSKMSASIGCVGGVRF